MARQTISTACATGAPVFLYYADNPPEPARRLKGVAYRSQCEGDLGHRMHTALANILETFRAAVLIGSDCPALQLPTLEQAVHALANCDVVLGPATDGGYYLIGCRQAVDPALFTGIPWSTSEVFSLTMQKCQNLGLSICQLSELRDVDTIEDLVHFPPLLHLAAEQESTNDDCPDEKAIHLS